MHGFRKGVGGDVWEATGDFKLAMDFIGDTDLRQARRYLKPRTDRLERAAAVIEALAEPKEPSPNRHQFVEPINSDFELVGATTSSETGPAGIEPATPRNETQSTSCSAEEKSPLTQPKSHDSDEIYGKRESKTVTKPSPPPHSSE